jgi:hypothetical protein
MSYREVLKDGPLPEVIDPWAEIGMYFHQLHSGMIEWMVQQLQDPLIDMGYLIGKESSLQVTQGREPDLFVQTDRQPSASVLLWDYVGAAQQIHAEPGLEVDSENDLQNLTIRDGESGDVVTVVEIISPSNKVNYMEMQDYQHRRNTLRVEKNIHVVELRPITSPCIWLVPTSV